MENKENKKSSLISRILTSSLIFLMAMLFLFMLVILMGYTFVFVVVMSLPIALIAGWMITPPEGERRYFNFFLRLFTTSVMLVGALAPFRVAAMLLVPVIKPEVVNDSFAPFIFPGPSFETLVGICAIIVGAGYLSEALWRLKTARQVKNLPRSKARSAQIGLAEFYGRARQTGPLQNRPGKLPEKTLFYFLADTPDGIEGNLMTDWLRTPVTRPFWLEDDTGRILVDLSNAKYGGSLMQFFLGHRICEVIMTSHVDKDAFPDAWLEEGDEIYIVGRVEERDDVPPGAPDSERLVIRLTPQASVMDSLLSKFGIDLSGRGRRDIHDVFILSDRGEGETGKIIMRGLMVRLAVALTWIALGLLNMKFAASLYEVLKGL